MQKYVIWIFGGGIGIIVITLSVISLLGRDPEAYIGSIGVLVTLIATSGILTQVLGKTREEVAQVKTQTNGRLTELLERLDAAHERELNLARALNPEVRVDAEPVEDYS